MYFVVPLNHTLPRVWICWEKIGKSGMKKSRLYCTCFRKIRQWGSDDSAEYVCKETLICCRHASPESLSVTDQPGCAFCYLTDRRFGVKLVKQGWDIFLLNTAPTRIFHGHDWVWLLLPMLGGLIISLQMKEKQDSYINHFEKSVHGIGSLRKLRNWWLGWRYSGDTGFSCSNRRSMLRRQHPKVHCVYHVLQFNSLEPIRI